MGEIWFSGLGDDMNVQPFPSLSLTISPTPSRLSLFPSLTLPLLPIPKPFLPKFPIPPSPLPDNG